MWIENISWHDVQKGRHHDCGANSMLIQIGDPGDPHPAPKHQFAEVHQFSFWDTESNVTTFPENEKISDEQAAEIVALLKHAMGNNMNVIVHCVMGVCRSGAVADVGVAMGFQDAGNWRAPNLSVKHKMMKALGWTYDSSEAPYQVDEGIVTITGERMQNV